MSPIILMVTGKDGKPAPGMEVPANFYPPPDTLYKHLI